MSMAGPPRPTFSPMNSIGASSISPSPITTVPSICTVSKDLRMASTAAPSASFFLPRPIQREAASAAASVTRTSSRARLRSVTANSAADRVVLMARFSGFSRVTRLIGRRLDDFGRGHNRADH